MRSSLTPTLWILRSRQYPGPCDHQEGFCIGESQNTSCKQHVGAEMYAKDFETFLPLKLLHNAMKTAFQAFLLNICPQLFGLKLLKIMRYM